MHTYVMQLRRLIGAARRRRPGERVDPRTSCAGTAAAISLDAGPGRFDVAEYDRLAAEGHKAARRPTTVSPRTRGSRPP
ncbi:hypothetical protein LT493_02220 [Streptomyces tricolor]|nr:hypothetical protein [Streptomyces tricolor]